MQRKIIISLTLNVVTFYMVGLSNIWVQEQAYDNKNIHPLIDQGFRLIPYNQDLLFINDYILVSIVGCTLLLLFFHKKRGEILLRWSMMLNILFTLRSITVPSTILTRPVELHKEWKSCKTFGYDYNSYYGPAEIIIKNKHTCFDFIFSGHMVNTIICAKLLIKYITYKWMNLVQLVCLVEAIVIIATRSHYLIDIEISFVLTYLVWQLLEYRELLEGANRAEVDTGAIQEV